MKGFLCPVFILVSMSVVAQSIVARLDNGSFEGRPAMETTPSGWFECKIGTTPDILPGPWGVKNKPSKGATFVGLITREDGTGESIGQKLNKPLKEKGCYTLSLDLAHSDTYAGYNEPIKLRIWGGASKCGCDQLIAESAFIKKSQWQTFDFEFTAKTDIQYIVLEAFYRDEKFSHKGNILIDNIKPITRCVRAFFVNRGTWSVNDNFKNLSLVH